MTTLFEAAGKGSGKACWVLMRRARADKFASASSAAIPSPFQVVTSYRSEKPDRYWSAPRRAKRPVIPITEIGYVRRSEIAALLAVLSRVSLEIAAPLKAPLQH